MIPRQPFASDTSPDETGNKPELPSTPGSRKSSNWQDEQNRLWRARARDYSKLDWVNKKDFLQAMVDFSDPQPDWNVLDAGTGPGVVAAAIAPHVDAVTGIDINAEMIEQARTNHGHMENVSFAIGDVENLNGFFQDHFDLVVARMMFHHVGDCMQGLSEIFRTLKPNGSCVVCEGVPPDHRTREQYIKIFALKEKRHTFSEADLINMFDQSGFHDILIKPFFMRQVSLNNWLENAALAAGIIDEIRRLHVEADDHFKHVYRLTERDGDVFMDWKFILIKGRKPSEPA